MVKNGFKRTLNTLLGHSTGLFMAWSLLVLALPTRQYLSPSAAAGGAPARHGRRARCGGREEACAWAGVAQRAEVLALLIEAR